jgi:FkbM family methyltransferase
LTYPAMTAVDFVRRHSPEGRRRRKDMASLYRQFARSGDIIFDIGANVGNRIPACLDIGATVVAVEPQEHCLRHLRRRFESSSRVKIVPSAVGPQPGEQELWISDAHTLSSMSPDWIEQHRKSGRFGEFSWRTSVVVPVTTLDDLISTYGRPAFCKIDAEGFEREILAGLSSSIPTLSFEFVGGYLDPATACAQRCLELGSYRFNFALGESMQLALPRWVELNELLVALGRLQIDADWGDIYASTNSYPSAGQ